MMAPMIITELTCKEFVELVTDYFEGALPPGERARFEAHIAGCDACVFYFAQMRLTIQALGRLTEETIPAESRQVLLQVFRDWKRGE